jgi:hypothetical protein
MPIVAEMITDLNFSVAFIILKLYNKNIENATAKVNPTDCIIKPGFVLLNALLNIADIAPRKNPSNKPYAGAK